MLEPPQHVVGYMKDIDMNVGKDIYFDLFYSSLKTNNMRQFIDVLSKGASPLCGAESIELSETLMSLQNEKLYSIGDGVGIFDFKSAMIEKPLIAIATLDSPLVLPADMHSQMVDIVAAVFSPQSFGPLHLQRLAFVSRVLKCEELRSALRDAKEEDTMRALFMPSQDWMAAA